jgi:hypothetical protein
MKATERVENFIKGHKYTLVSDKPDKSDTWFKCICGGRGKNGYLIKDENGVITKVGEKCLSYCVDYTYEDVTKRAQEQLRNRVWESKYKEYAERISVNLEKITAYKGTSSDWAPFNIYLNTTNAKTIGKSITFELRCLGQTVAAVKCDEGKKAVYTSEYIEKNKKHFHCGDTLNGEDWDNPKTVSFRKAIEEAIKKGHASPKVKEHRLESLVLTKLSDGFIPCLHPMQIGGARYPMPTKLSASGSLVMYSKSWGCIDIFTRVHADDGMFYPCVVELKDGNNEIEPARKVIKQALAYTVFIRELLRSPKTGAEIWWKLFGFERQLPQSCEPLKLFAVCMMPDKKPDEKAADTSFGNTCIDVDGDKIYLHYVYFRYKDSGFEIEDDYKSSLPT